MVKPALRWLLAAGMAYAGIMHFLATDEFAKVIPDFLPVHRLLVQVSGACEIGLAVGLLPPVTRRWSGWGLIALFVAVFPANINMAVQNMPIHGHRYPALLWLRLPMQAVLMAWAWWVSKPNEGPAGSSGTAGI